MAATLLAAQGREVRLILVGERDALKGDAALAARDWTGATLPGDAATVAAAASDASLIIDALFGAGLDRPVAGVPLAVRSSSVLGMPSGPIWTITCGNPSGLRMNSP